MMQAIRKTAQGLPENLESPHTAEALPLDTYPQRTEGRRYRGTPGFLATINTTDKDESNPSVHRQLDNSLLHMARILLSLKTEGAQWLSAFARV